ncbi:MAG: insulinase family protein, partial [Candidatus Zixiibacteriota bacterium]
MTKKLITVIAVCALTLSVLASAALAQDIDKLKFPQLNELKIPDIQTMTFDNGMRLYVLEDRSLPLFHVAVRVNCGDFLEPAEKIGMAGICGSVMRTGGTEKWSGDEIDELLEGIGGSVETFIGTTSAGASVNVLSEYTDTG